MSLYGALFGGVSGLRAQSSKIGVISDNIANVNTIGFKQATATFQTLVVNSNNSGTYQTGGVRGGSAMNVSKQGLLQSTESATDIAISGAGFFVVRKTPTFIQGDTTATPYYTRAGSFTQDSLGNFRNAQGFFLQGWPLDREGRLPGEVGNLNTTSFTNFDSLETVNVESASGVALATSQLALGANLRASQAVYPGQAITLQPDTNTPNNLNLPSNGIIVASEYGLATANDVRRGDLLNVSSGNGLDFTYEYGGFTIGRKVTQADGLLNYGDNGLNNTALVERESTADINYIVANGIDITIPNHGLVTGDTLTLSGFNTALGATGIAQLNTTHVVTRIDANTVRISPTPAHGQVFPSAPAVVDDFLADVRKFSGNVMDATSPIGALLSQTGIAAYTTAGLTFSISTASAGTKIFKYTTTAPNTLGGELNSIASIARAINSVEGMAARVVDGRLLVGASDASEAVTFANGDISGNLSQAGIDWVGELGLQDVSAGNRRYSSLEGLSVLVNADEGLSATITNPLSAASININVDDPLDTITLNDPGVVPTQITTVGNPITIPVGTYPKGSTISVTINDVPPADLVVLQQVVISGLADGLGGLPGMLPNGGPWTVTALTPGSYTVSVVTTQDIDIAGGNFPAALGNRISVVGESNQGSMLAHLGAMPSLNGADYAATIAAQRTTGVLGPQYDPTGSVGGNMASGAITAQFSRNVRVYDGLGSGHDVRFSFIKIAQNTWALELHAIPEDDVSTPLVNGQLATGSVVFNGDGTLRSVSASLQNAITVNWRNGAEPSVINLALGTAGQSFSTAGATVIGLSDGLSQFDSAYNVNFADQNGAPVGQLVSVSIGADGIVTASYSNGETQELYKLPLADFANPDGLLSVSGNVFSQTRDSGEVNLRETGSNGTGTLVSAALEQSNVDLAEQLTDMIVAQRSYQANTRVIKTADELLEQLNQI